MRANFCKARGSLQTLYSPPRSASAHFPGPTSRLQSHQRGCPCRNSL